MNKKFAWYKYREHTAGAISAWKYIHVPVVTYMKQAEWVGEYLKGFLSTWNEHFRKIEIQKANKVPIEILDATINDLSESIKSRKEELKWVKLDKLANRVCKKLKAFKK